MSAPPADHPRYFAVRRLEPFRGTLQLVEVHEARALSADGRQWQVELLTVNAHRQPVWGNIGPSSLERRFFTYGVWQEGAEVLRVPVNPVLGDQSGHPSLAPLLAALQSMPPLPFALADTLELWLLDGAAGLPLALVRSLTARTAPPLPRAPVWQGAPWNDTSFVSPTLVAAGQQGSHRERLAELVQASAGQPARAQWFQRDADGAGLGLDGYRLAPEHRDRRLGAEAFPELLLREQWPVGEDAALVADFLDWLAPALLTLPRISRASRGRLERAAARRAAVLYRYRRLLPEVVEPTVITPALVEAVVRQTRE
jgi:hypothetical protein